MNAINTTNCTDINGVGINEFKFNIDGTVVGVNNIIDPPIERNLSYQCCTAKGWYFDPTNTKCYWSPTCVTGGAYNIVLDPQGNTGGLFQVTQEEKKYCTLELNFSFLLRVDCQKLVGSLKTFLENIHLEVSIEKMIYDESLPIPNALEEVVRTDLFKIDNLVSFFNGNTNTGILLNSVDNTIGGGGGVVSSKSSNQSNDKLTNQIPPQTCTQVRNKFIVDMGSNSGVINEFSLNSDWVDVSLIINDKSILESIFNERLKISIIGNTLTNFAILLDDIQLNKVCRTPNPPPFFNTECPKFELKRLIDNKKSWVENTSKTTRVFDLLRRETKYSINHEKLSINTKEIDLSLNPALAIENDVIETIINNECLLAPSTGCTGPVTIHNCVDLRPFITTEIVDNNDLINMLVDVKNRKTLSAYPTLELLYYRYLNSLEHCGVSTNGLNIESINTFLDLIGLYWSDLVEQVVPATTIWGSSTVSSDVGSVASPSVIGGASKFVYRKGTTFFCVGAPSYPVPSPINGSGKFGVLLEDITTYNSISTPSKPQSCTAVSVRQLDSGSEFLGIVTINGINERPTTGTTISINETIIEECNKFENC